MVWISRFMTSSSFFFWWVVPGLLLGPGVPDSVLGLGIARSGLGLGLGVFGSEILELFLDLVFFPNNLVQEIP